MGEPVSRVEGVDKVTGRARYTADVVIPGLLHAVLVQTQIPHGHVIEQSLRHTADRVSRAPGVLHVLTPMNCPALQQLPRELTFDLPLERR
ncbi:aldehyde oxidase and xanthine dehydrogenase, partial [Mycolicibacterium fortuitum subsp. fortuitum DSM 46621 = ATCC 6841 = JCM 6387]